MGEEILLALVCLALVSAAGPVLVVLILGRAAQDFSSKLLTSLDTVAVRIISHLNEHRMIGGKPRDLYDQELRLEEKRTDAETKRQEILIQEHLESQRRIGAERDPFSGRRS